MACRGGHGCGGRRDRLAHAAGIALAGVVGGPTATLVGALLFGGTFIGISTITLAAGRVLGSASAVALLTTGYSAGQIVGPLAVTPLLHNGFRAALTRGAGRPAAARCPRPPAESGARRG